MFDICIKRNKLCDHCSSIGCVLLKNNHLQSLFTDTYLWMCAITFARIDNQFLLVQGDPIIALVNSMFDNADSYPNDGQLDPEELWDTLEIFDGDGEQHYSHVTHWNGKSSFWWKFCYRLHWKLLFWQLSSAASGENFVKLTFTFQCMSVITPKITTTRLFVQQTVQCSTK